LVWNSDGSAGSVRGRIERRTGNCFELACSVDFGWASRHHLVGIASVEFAEIGEHRSRERWSIG